MFKKSFLLFLIGFGVLGIFQVSETRGQTDINEYIVNQRRANYEGRIPALERQVRELNAKVKKPRDAGLVLFLFGTFCALWAQNTGRNPWLWFFMGLFFNIITALVLLSKNAQDRKAGILTEKH